MKDEKLYDCAIIGGGLGGLCLSIQLAKLGHGVILFEKEQYPFHKVCGEYISLESWDFLERIGIPLRNMQLPIIKKLLVTSPGGAALHVELPLGGFGISRYKIDHELMNLATQLGVQIRQNCKVEEAVFTDGYFSIHTTAGDFTSLVCCAAFGKKSNLDIKWKRPFTKKTNRKLDHYMAVKYHVQSDLSPDTIALHNFKNGYCGISRIENDRYCLCYLTNAANLQQSGNSIAEMENHILGMNPYLKKILENSTRLYDQPLTISQISFQQKTQVENNILMIGDAAGMIAPLCGNGMSMAMHGSKIAAGLIDQFLQGRISRAELETLYTIHWRNTFEKRLKTGRMIQRFFGRKWITNLFVYALRLFPGFSRWLVKQTHGAPF